MTNAQDMIKVASEKASENASEKNEQQKGLSAKNVAIAAMESLPIVGIPVSSAAGLTYGTKGGHGLAGALGGRAAAFGAEDKNSGDFRLPGILAAYGLGGAGLGALMGRQRIHANTSRPMRDNAVMMGAGAVTLGGAKYAAGKYLGKRYSDKELEEAGDEKMTKRNRNPDEARRIIEASKRRKKEENK